ncbi:MAG: glycosyltransferase family 4 protein [Clostridia bacterium]
MKIAVIGHKRIPSRDGGVEIVVEELCTRFVKRGHEVTCYSRSRKEYEKIKEYKGIKIKPVLTIDIRGIAAMTSSLFASIRAAFGCYDVVHFHAEGPSAMCWLPKLFGKKIVVTIHGLDWQRSKWGGFATKYLLFGEKMAVKFADEIIVLSKNVKEYFKNTYNRDTVFISNGIEKPVCAEAKTITEKWNLTKDSYILYLGRIVPEKGITYLIDAYLKLNTDKKLVIAGGSSDTDVFLEEIKDICKHNDNIVFTDFVVGQELDELYSNAYVYVLPSDLEGMPMSLLEAMSYGNCCVVSDIPECAEVVEDKAVVFKKGNVGELAKKLQQLCDDEELVSNYKKDASDYICKKYNWDDVVDKTLELYTVK